MWMWMSIMLTAMAGEQNSEWSAINWWSTWDDPLLIDAIETGLTNTPDANIAVQRVLQSEAMAKQMRAGFLPSLSASVSSNTQPAEALGFGFGLSNLSSMFPSDGTAEEDDSSDLFTSATMALQVGVPLDIWGTSFTNYQAGLSDAKAANQDYLTSLRSLSLMIANAYYDVVAIQSQYAIVLEQLQLGEVLLEITEMRHQRGDATVLDVLQQRQQLSALNTQKVRIEQQMQLSMQRLMLLLGESPTKSTNIQDGFPNIPIYNKEILTQALSYRPELLSAQQRLESAQKRKYVAMTQMLPKLSIGGKLSRQANYQDDPDDPWNTLDSWALSTSATVTLFQGGGQWNALQSAEAAVVIAEENLRKVSLQIEQEIEQAVLTETQQQEIIQLATQQKEVALSAYQEAKTQYQKGITPFVTVLSNQQAYQQSQLTLLQSQRDSVRIRLQTISSFGFTSDILDGLNE